MRRYTSFGFAVLILGLLVVASTAVLAAAHFVSGPDCREQNGSLIARGKIAGLGSHTVSIVLEAEATTICRNRGNNVPPGQTEHLSGQLQIEPRNGRVSFNVSTGPITNPCPGQMRPETTFANVRVTVTQADGTVLQQSCSL